MKLKPQLGIVIFFSEKADLEKYNASLTSGDQAYFPIAPIKENRQLKLEFGSFSTGGGAIQVYCYGSYEYRDQTGLKPACPIGFAYDAVVWIKNLRGKILWQNQDYEVNGSPKNQPSKTTHDCHYTEKSQPFCVTCGKLLGGF